MSQTVENAHGTVNGCNVEWSETPRERISGKRSEHVHVHTLKKRNHCTVLNLFPPHTPHTQRNVS
jgi:hypothetical protein